MDLPQNQSSKEASYDRLAIISAILGIVLILVSILLGPKGGTPALSVTLIASVYGLKSKTKRKWAVVGLVLSVIYVFLALLAISRGIGSGQM